MIKNQGIMLSFFVFNLRKTGKLWVLIKDQPIIVWYRKPT